MYVVRFFHYVITVFNFIDRNVLLLYIMYKYYIILKVTK